VATLLLLVFLIDIIVLPKHISHCKSTGSVSVLIHDNPPIEKASPMAT